MSYYCKELLQPITDWFEKHKPSCEEAFYQVDSVNEALPELGIACLKVVRKIQHNDHN